MAMMQFEVGMKSGFSLESRINKKSYIHGRTDPETGKNNTARHLLRMCGPYEVTFELFVSHFQIPVEIMVKTRRYISPLLNLKTLLKQI
jgi:hypothetical protein